MSYQAVTIPDPAHTSTGGSNYLSGIRDLDGKLWLAKYVPDDSPAATRLWYSIDEGATWTAESWSQDVGVGPNSNAGGDDPVLMCDHAGVIWMGMSKYDGTTKPTVVKRKGTEMRWGDSQGEAGVFHQWAISGATSVRFVMDTSRRVGGWFSNPCLCYISSAGKVSYADFYVGAGEVVNSTGTASDCRIACTASGIRYVVWIESNKAWVASKSGSSGSWSSRVQVSDASHVVLSIEDVKIRPTYDTLAVLYRESTTNSWLYLAEVDETGDAYTQTRIQNGAENYSFYAGSSLMYDERGSVFIAALYNTGGLGLAEVWTFEMLRAAGASTWSATARTSTSGSNVLDTCGLCYQTPAKNGFKPGLLYQGMCFFTYVWPAGAAASDQVVYWINRNTYSNSSGAYPTKFSMASGELPYRSEDTYAGSTVGLDGEGSSAATYPLSESVASYSDERVFVTDVAEFQAGWSATIARYPSGRRVMSVETVPLEATDKDTLRDFLLARARAAEAFTFTPPESGASALTVFCPSESLETVKIDVGLFVLRFRLEEVL